MNSLKTIKYQLNLKLKKLNVHHAKRKNKILKVSVISKKVELTLVTVAPAPAATTAEQVDTLKVSKPSPPVPTISQVGPTASKP